MVTLDRIEKELINNFADGELAVSTFREILGVLSFDGSISSQLDSILQSVDTLLPIAESFDHKYTDVWHRWAVTIQMVRGILKYIPDNASLGTKKLSNPWQGKLGKFPLITCIVTPIQNAAPAGILPAKAILLIRSYGRTRNDGAFSDAYPDFEKFLCDSIRKACARPAGPIWKDFVPSWPRESAAEWQDAFLHNTRYVKPVHLYFSHPVRNELQVIHALKKTIELVSSKEGSATKNNSRPPTHSPDTQTQARAQTVVIQASDDHEEGQPKKKRAKRPAFNYVHEQTTGPSLDVEGLDPVSVQVAPQAETPSDQPTLPSSVQSLDVRYTNYRTSMDNQRLPWDWDCQNVFEIEALLAALGASSEKSNPPVLEKQGALMVWLLLVTGQSIEEILKFTLGHTQGGRSSLIPGPIYVRSILPPPHSFQPSPKQQHRLASHASAIELALPSPFPSLLMELGLIKSNVAPISAKPNLGTYLTLDKHGAESAVRQFLENHRTRNLRLLPGRIRNTLSKEIMRVTNDPVITHLLASLPTDLPPTGVYYTAYPKERLESAYQETMVRIFRSRK